MEVQDRPQFWSKKVATLSLVELLKELGVVSEQAKQQFIVELIQHQDFQTFYSSEPIYPSRPSITKIST